MDSCTIVGAEFVHKLVKCGLFHPQSIGFFLEKQDSNNNSCKPEYAQDFLGSNRVLKI